MVKKKHYDSKYRYKQVNFGVQIINNYKVQYCLMQDLELSSSQEPKPFIGRYHHVLRTRKNIQNKVAVHQKKQYKPKKISYKSLYFLQAYTHIEAPLSQNHVYNFHNILAINEHSMRNPDCEESFISSKFYMKRVKKVSIQKGCLLLALEDYDNEGTPVAYICERLKSMGNTTLLEIAETIEHLESTHPEFKQKLAKDVDEQEQGLSKFLNEMTNRPFFSQYSPHLLIISSKLLEILGYQTEEFAVQSIKYKSILNEFFSASNYTEIIRKHLENINLLSHYLSGKMTLDEFCMQSQIVLTDCIYTRQNKKIKCQFFGGTSRQLTPYIEIKELHSDQEEVMQQSSRISDRKDKIQELKQTHQRKQINLLQSLISIPKQLDPHFKTKICGYKLLQCLMQNSSDDSRE